jgi:lincosamide nucleotidyltransferase A/C/D/E
MMSAHDVVDLYRQLNEANIRIWIDGGWAVDALLGRELRLHKDLDIALEERDVPALRTILGARGYGEIPRDDSSAWNFVLGDADGHEIDVHVIVLDEGGNGIYGPKENDEMYPAASLGGEGIIAGQKVRCISAEYMVRFITPWLHKRREYDFKSISALCDEFGIPCPPEYRQYRPQQ